MDYDKILPVSSTSLYAALGNTVHTITKICANNIFANLPNSGKRLKELHKYPPHLPKQ
jgi:hypothetical protein